MFITLYRWPKKFIIALFLSVFLLAFFSVFIFLTPVYEKIQSLQKQTIVLNHQWQQRRTEAIQRQQLQQDTLLLQYPYVERLRDLHRQMTPAELYTQIALLAKSHALPILALKPQKQQTIANLKQQILTLNINGSELKILNFLQLLMHQTWLLEIQQLELTPTSTGVHLQAVLAAYYDAN